MSLSHEMLPIVKFLCAPQVCPFQALVAAEWDGILKMLQKVWASSVEGVDRPCTCRRALPSSPFEAPWESD